MNRLQTLQDAGIVRIGGALVPNLPALVMLISLAAPELGVRAYYRWAGNGRDVLMIKFNGAPPVCELDVYPFAHAKARLRCALEAFGLSVSAALLDDALEAMDHTPAWQANWAEQSHTTEAEIDRDIAREQRAGIQNRDRGEAERSSEDFGAIFGSGNGQ